MSEICKPSKTLGFAIVRMFSSPFSIHVSWPGLSKDLGGAAGTQGQKIAPYRDHFFDLVPRVQGEPCRSLLPLPKVVPATGDTRLLLPVVLLLLLLLLLLVAPERRAPPKGGPFLEMFVGQWDATSLHEKHNLPVHGLKFQTT